MNSKLTVSKLVLAALLAVLPACNGDNGQATTDFLANFHSAKLTVIDVELIDRAGKKHDVETLVEIAQLSRGLSEAGRKINYAEKLEGKKRILIGTMNLEFTHAPSVKGLEVYAYPEEGIAEFMLPDSSGKGYNYRAAGGIEILANAFELKAEDLLKEKE
jgi:hypothetical protein